MFIIDYFLLIYLLKCSAGLAFSTTAASRGHNVTLFERKGTIGGQFNLAKQIPGKEEFHETLRYFASQLQLSGVNLRLNTDATIENLKGFDAIVIASGIIPRQVKLNNKSSRVKIHSYVDVLQGSSTPIGKNVAIIGAGGIGFDLAEYLTHDGSDHHISSPLSPDIDNEAIAKFLDEWGVDTTIERGGLKKPIAPSSPRKVYLLQRKQGKMGGALGKTTGWIHRASLKSRGVVELSGCSYEEVNDEGLVISQVTSKDAPPKKITLPVDDIVICAGQEPLNDFKTAFEGSPAKVFVIGGALEASELDAKRAIDQGVRLATMVEKANSGDVFNAPVDFMAKIYQFFNKK